MKRLSVFKHPIAIGLLLILGVVVGSYILFGQGLGDAPSQTVPVSILATADFTTEGQPVQPFAAVDPAISDALLQTIPFGIEDFVVEGIPPIGQYVSGVEGSYQFDLANRSDLALDPFAIPEPSDNSLIENFDEFPIVSDAVGEEAILDYGGDDCAPAGLPVTGVLTQRYHNFHAGIDIGVPLGTPVQTTHSGTIQFAGWSTYGYGYLVIVENETYITYYAHLTNFNVQGDDVVGRGSVIGWSGSTGNSTGPHVHYETRINDVTVDPLTFENRRLGTC